MVSKANLEKVLEDWKDRNGWEVTIGPLTPSDDIIPDVLSITDRGKLVAFYIPVPRIYELESGPDYLEVRTTRVTFTFAQGEVKVLHK